MVIPAWIRKKLGIDKGDKLLVDVKGDEIVLRLLLSSQKLWGIDKIKEAQKRSKKSGENEEFEVSSRY
ncbi:MAG TPA: AbrB/MazE/SpoVT family DNA-binding domain-containing protein [Archaeoglobus veneficus]|nr:AbrB/MazE/SpoVT family DNA-binding domain-containing protein [Archaeoglobus veneficus]